MGTLATFIITVILMLLGFVGSIFVANVRSKQIMPSQVRLFD